MMEPDYVEMLPDLYSGEELVNRLRIIPEYDPTIREQDMAERLLRLSDIYRIYLPSAMSVEIYNKIYLATAMSLRKKSTRQAITQQIDNFKSMQSGEYRGIIGGADSFTIIGSSGIGKSSAIDRAIRLISEKGIIETKVPYAKIIPCLSVQCPFDCSSKGMLLEILRSVDTILETRYYERSQRAGVTTDILIGTVAQVAINHIGVLIIDEIQHISGHKGGKALMQMFTQLINCSGISICMVGTPECLPFFEQTLQLARRSMGLRYGTLPCDDYFRDFCGLIFSFQYVRKASEICDPIIEWLYEHSAGVISVVVSLIHDAQEIAIFNGREALDLGALSEAYEKRLSLLHGYIAPKERREKTVHPKREEVVNLTGSDQVYLDQTGIPELIKRAKEEGRETLSLMKEHFTVTVIRL